MSELLSWPRPSPEVECVIRIGDCGVKEVEVSGEGKFRAYKCLSSDEICTLARQSRLAELEGGDLFRALFDGHERSTNLLRNALEDARRRRTYLQLRFDAPPALHSLPWEMLRDPSRLDIPAWGLHSHLSLVRSGDITMDTSKVDLPELERLRVLLVSAFPPMADLAKIDAARHFSSLEEILGSRDDSSLTVDVERLEGATKESISAKLRGNHFDVVHFLCHGSISRGDPTDIRMILQDEEGRCSPVPAAELRDLLIESNTRAQLVFLSVCHGGTSTGAPDSPGLARELLHAAPQVVGFHSTVGIDDALDASCEFYKSLLTDGRAGHAANAARKYLKHKADWSSATFWSELVLYSSRPRARVWRPALSRTSVLTAESWPTERSSLTAAKSWIPVVGSRLSSGFWERVETAATGSLPCRFGPGCAEEVARRQLSALGGAELDGDERVVDLGCRVARTLRNVLNQSDFEALRGLAKMRSAYYLTTSYHPLLKVALERAGRKAHWHSFPRNYVDDRLEWRDYLELEASPETPVVLHLLGHWQAGDLALDEPARNKTLYYLEPTRLPWDLVHRLAVDPLIFVGLDFENAFDRRLVEKLLQSMAKGAGRSTALVQVSPDPSPQVLAHLHALKERWQRAVDLRILLASASEVIRRLVKGGTT